MIDEEWWKLNQTVQILHCIPFDKMEPYVMVKRSSETPLYDPLFINYGFNKVEFIMELRQSGEIRM